MAVMVDGLHQCVQASQHHQATFSGQVSDSGVSAADQDHSFPLEHKDCDVCDTCSNCPCHASLTMQPFQLRYNPSVLELRTDDPFQYLPEVYPSKFIPPQNLA